MPRYQPATLAEHWQRDHKRFELVRDFSLGEPGATLDTARMAAYRYARLQEQLTRAVFVPSAGSAVLFDSATHCGLQFRISSAKCVSHRPFAAECTHADKRDEIFAENIVAASS